MYLEPVDQVLLVLDHLYEGEEGGEGGEVLDHLGQAGHLPYPLQRRLTYLKPKLAMNYTAAISVVDTYNFDPDSDQGSEKFRYGSESRQKRKLVQEHLKICYKILPIHMHCVFKLYYLTLTFLYIIIK